MIAHLRDQVTQARRQGGRVGLAEAMLPLAYAAAASGDGHKAAQLIACADQAPLFNAPMYEHRKKILAMVRRLVDRQELAKIRLNGVSPIDAVIATEIGI